MRDLCTCGQELGVWVDGVQTPFEKGVGSHAPSEVTFNVDGMNATKFTAVAGIGMEQGGNSNVNFIVKVDGKEVWRQDAVTFKTSVPVEVDITGAKTVSLMTETNGADSNDHAVWADAKIFNDAEPVDVTALQEELDAYAELEPNAADYAKNSWDAYAAAALEGKDKIDPAVYTEERFQAMKTALADAENVLADPAASNEDVTAAIDALEKAEAGLVTVTDAYRAELLRLVQAFEAKNEEDYSAASWTAYETLAEEARVLMNDPDAAAEDMKDMRDELAAAEEALIYTAGLRDAVAGYADKDQVNYTVDS